jgi:hypothetical protein
LVISQGQYLDTTGQPSSFDVLQSEIYNNFTYQITLDAEIAKYRDTLLNLVHPAGMKVIGRYAMKSNSDMMFTAESALESGQPLGYYTGDTGSFVTMSSTWENASNNIVTFNALVGANLQNFIASILGKSRPNNIKQTRRRCGYTISFGYFLSFSRTKNNSRIL